MPFPNFAFFPSLQEFIQVVALVTMLRVPLWEQSDDVKRLDLVELFAGKARVSRMAAWVGYRTRAYDLSYAPVVRPDALKRRKYRRGCMDQRA